MSAPAVTRRLALGGLAGLGVAHAAQASDLRPIPRAAVTTVATGLKTPEGVAADRAGNLFVSNQASVCVVINRQGVQRHLGPAGGASNGIALDGKGGLMVATFGLIHNEPGPLLRLDLRTGRLERVAETVDGRTLVASNCPTVSADGWTYCTHSKWDQPGRIGDRRAEGFVYRARDGRTELVAAGIRGANGCCFDRGERHLYVSQTPAGNVLRLRRLPSGGFGPPEPYGPALGEVTPDAEVGEIRTRIAAGDRSFGYTDGLAFDAAGDLWVTLPFANKVVAITPDHRVVTMISDPTGEFMDMPTNLAFGGPDLRDLYVVSRQGGSVIRTRSPIPGLPLVGQ